MTNNLSQHRTHRTFQPSTMNGSTLRVSFFKPCIAKKQKNLVLCSATTLLWIFLAFSISSDAATHATDTETQTSVVAMDIDNQLSIVLTDAYQKLGDDYKPRTEHFLENGDPKYINRLIQEASPYLRQHAHNPVNWYPWGEKAFAAAVKADKPVFLSIGYATCHWCHVMERESFENEDIAGLMNEHFISIKVDREQLPDVDALYMSAVMMIYGSGGWPMSSFLDTTGRSFYGATYFPPDQFTQILQRINTLWKDEPEALLAHAAEVAEAVSHQNDTSSAAINVGLREVARAFRNAQDSFDAEKGGFGGAPKFPRESTLYFLLDHAMRSLPDQQEDAYSSLKMADTTLVQMAAGGIHDHVGGGFHRYAVDSLWRVPHFEKMLYNQAALARNYAQAYQLTGNPDHKRTAKRILDYVLREMRAPNGMFYSATDADSEGEEGRFFIWTPEQLDEVLGEEDAQLAKQVWNVTGEGNFEGTTILHLQQTPEALASQFGLEPAELTAKLNQWTTTMRTAREQREHPLRDEKVISSWNGMMISAFAKASERLNSPHYLNAAVTAANALWETLRKDDGSLQRIYFNQQTSIDGTQADYAYVAEAYLALYDSTSARIWLARAVALTDIMNERFWDEKNGAYFMGAHVVAGTILSTRPKELFDNSIPSGNSVALRVLSQLFKRTGNPDFEARANRLIAALSSRLTQQPSGFFYLLTGVNEHLAGEAGDLQYGGRGVVRAEAAKHDDKLVVTVTLADGWHVNSNAPLQDYLIPTELTNTAGRSLENINFPQARLRTLGFQRAELSLYENEFELQAKWPGHKEANSTVVNLQVQACNDEICLAPETLVMTIYP
ncbi:MAG: hypothetical protein ACI9XK_000493 [Granulosicoccus sp.]|jgi:uncharacterized protein YyaL (SSP411 family)